MGKTSEWVLTFFDRLSFVALVVDPFMDSHSPTSDRLSSVVRHTDGHL
jgi:hypothetical protein